MNEGTSRTRGRYVGVATEGGAAPSTRDRILEIALDLFIEKGFDKSSLREIAERLGFSKAAIYYHFASKDDILMALHMRLHDIGRQAIEGLRQLPAGADSWAALLDELVAEMLANRKIFVMHDRNRSAFEQLHRREHAGAHEEIEDELRRAIGDTSLSWRDRVRMASAAGAVFTTLAVYGDLLRDVPSDELGEQLRATVGELLGRGAKSRRTAPRLPAPAGGTARPSRAAGRSPSPGRRSAR